MNKIKVNKHIPIPGMSWAKYPFADLQVGDSFFIPGKTSTYMGGTLVYWAKKLGHTYSQRTVTENGVNGVRVWRIT